MRAGFSFSYPSISLLLGQPLSIKKSYAGAIHWQLLMIKVCISGEEFAVKRKLLCFIRTRKCIRQKDDSQSKDDKWR
jgi:hypothetical protein